MTLFKLSLRNARRQAREYLVYFATVVLAVALIYAFNGLVFSDELRALSLRMDELPLIIALASIAVVAIFGWLVSYATAFMLSCRSRELGTYLLIGLENQQVARLFFLENLAVGGCAFLLGALLGSLLYQVLRAVVLALFDTPYFFSLALSLPALALTLVYFALIYLYALTRSRKRICSMKIYDLLYFDRQNEGVVIQSSGKRQRIFAVSIVLGIIGTLLLMAGNLALGIIGAGLIIVFLYSFFLSFASGVPAFFDKRPEKKYQGQNLLVFRTLTAKLATMGVIMATIALLFTATLISEGSGLVFRALFQGRIEQSVCYDLFLSTERPDNQALASALDYIESNIPLDASWQYDVHLGENAQITDYLETHAAYYRHYDRDTLMSASDYAALRHMLGYPEVSLAAGTYLIHCQPHIAEALANWSQPFTAGDVTLAPGGVHTETFAQYVWDANGQGFILVVPDEIAQASPINHSVYAAMTKRPVTAAQYSDMEAILESAPYQDVVLYTKANEEASAATMTAMIVFPLYYLALALTMSAATILSIQQLSETERYRRHFQLLNKLGMDRREMARALRKQFTLYYAMPAVPPILIGVPFILSLGSATEPGVLVGASSPSVIASIALGLFFLVYAIYILLAYTSLKRSVLPL